LVKAAVSNGAIVSQAISSTPTPELGNNRLTAIFRPAGLARFSGKTGSGVNGSCTNDEAGEKLSDTKSKRSSVRPISQSRPGPTGALAPVPLLAISIGGGRYRKIAAISATVTIIPAKS
jgi:hypothetical protein